MNKELKILYWVSVIYSFATLVAGWIIAGMLASRSSVFVVIGLFFVVVGTIGLVYATTETAIGKQKQIRKIDKKIAGLINYRESVRMSIPDSTDEKQTDH